jgi:Ca2+-binding EF-hand superfamily protein
MEDMKLVVGCLMAEEIDGSSQITVGNVEELFHTMDQNHSGKVNYEEFKDFYDTVLKSKAPSSGRI